MSMQSLPTVADSKITPASASFKSATIPSELASFIDCLFGNRTATTAKTGGRPQLQLEMDRTLPHTKQILDEKLDKVVEAVVEGAKVEEKKLQRNPESPECSKATVSEADNARTNWLELRERVENVGPRVFAYHDDPKYLQQCEEAKQRRATAAAMCISPSWH